LKSAGRRAKERGKRVRVRDLPTANLPTVVANCQIVVYAKLAEKMEVQESESGDFVNRVCTFRTIAFASVSIGR
jgi:hypothetical protein